MTALLAPDERPVFDVSEGGGPFVVVCEHASNRLPRALGRLGLAPGDLVRHIAWDPGAQELATHIAEATASALVLQRYSRLAIDCNRDPAVADAVSVLSETTPIPGNDGLAPEARQARIDEVWAPFHDALAAVLDRRAAVGRPTALVTVHSFTPVFRGVSRPWHVGIISTDDHHLADAMLAVLRRDPSLVVGDNEPYKGKDNVDYTIRRHGRDRGLPHVMIEVRNDLIASPADIAAWGERLTAALVESVDGLGAGKAGAYA